MASEKTPDDYAAVLQDLWPRYLDALDRYTAAQKEIERLYASATFSLARANFANTTGRRYGETQFDGRMAAATRAAITDAGSLTVHSALRRPVKPKETKPADEAVHATELGKPGEQSDIAESDKAFVTETATESKASSTDEHDIEPGASRDPLRWFGVLTPQPLRQCQTDFITLTTGPLATAVGAATELRQLEKEIRRARKARAKASKAAKAS